MTIHAKVSGVWKEVTDPQTRVGGVWKEITEGYVRVSGVWKQFYQRAVITLSGESISDIEAAPGASFADLSVDSDGNVYKTEGAITSQIDAATDWIRPASEASAEYSVRATLDSGDTPTGTLGSWQTLDITRSWSLLQSIVGSKSCSLTVEISDDGGSTVVASNTYTLSVQLI